MCRRKVCDVGSQMWTRVCLGRRRHREPCTSNLGWGTEVWERQREARSRWRHQPGQHTVMGRHQRTPTATKQHPQNSSSCPDPRGPPGPAPSVPHVPPMPRARMSCKDGESCTKPHTFSSEEVCFPPCWLHVTVFLSGVRRSSNWICLRAMPGWAR